jgi:hypothetical protein
LCRPALFGFQEKERERKWRKLSLFEEEHGNFVYKTTLKDESIGTIVWLYEIERLISMREPFSELE